MHKLFQSKYLYEEIEPHIECIEIMPKMRRSLGVRLNGVRESICDATSFSLSLTLSLSFQQQKRENEANSKRNYEIEFIISLL